MASFDKRLKSILVKTGTLDEDTADTALLQCQEQKIDLGDYLVAFALPEAER